MENHFTTRASVKLFSPVVANLGKYLIWRSSRQFRLQGWGDKAYPISIGNHGKGTSHARLCFLMIRLARAVGRYPYKNEMRSERNPLGGRSLVVGRKDYKYFPGETPTGHNQETHRDTQKIIRPKDSNKSRPHLPEALAGMAGQRSRPRHHSPECTQSSGDSPLRISLLLRQAAAY